MILSVLDINKRQIGTDDVGPISIEVRSTRIEYSRSSIEKETPNRVSTSSTDRDRQVAARIPAMTMKSTICMVVQSTRVDGLSGLWIDSLPVWGLAHEHDNPNANVASNAYKASRRRRNPCKSI